MKGSRNTLLPQISFSILFALSMKPRHGYGLMQQIEHDSNGKVRTGSGALYGAIKSLRKDNLIEEMPFPEDNKGSERRRYYRLTKRGWDRLESEIAYFECTVRLARERKLTARQ